MTVPAVIVAGTHSASGKTTVTLAILAALKRRGLAVQGFKVGPDFIDPGHHTALTGRISRNLDTWLLDPSALATTYERATEGAQIAVIEGVMGLFDGRGAGDEAGSTADLARAGQLPVILVVDAKGMSRSIAPMIRGFSEFDPDVAVVAAIANRVGSRRHFDEYLLPAIRDSTHVESLGYLMRDDRLAIPSRHLGLQTAEEFSANDNFVAALAEATIDVDRLIELARPPCWPPSAQIVPKTIESGNVRVAVARDAAFCFYYEDNLDHLRDAGAEIVPFSPLNDRALPESTSLLYLGGGYPEIHASRIAQNHEMRQAIRQFHAEGGAIYAECGGMMACCRELRDLAGQHFPMWDLIPARAVMHSRFQALGYVTMKADRPTLLGPAGTEDSRP